MEDAILGSIHWLQQKAKDRAASQTPPTGDEYNDLLELCRDLGMHIEGAYPEIATALIELGNNG